MKLTTSTLIAVFLLPIVGFFACPVFSQIVPDRTVGTTVIATDESRLGQLQLLQEVHNPR